jgi:hypothetical protein
MAGGPSSGSSFKRCFSPGPARPRRYPQPDHSRSQSWRPTSKRTQLTRRTLSSTPTASTSRHESLSTRSPAFCGCHATPSNELSTTTPTPSPPPTPTTSCGRRCKPSSPSHDRIRAAGRPRRRKIRFTHPAATTYASSNPGRISSDHSTAVPEHPAGAGGRRGDEAGGAVPLPDLFQHYRAELTRCDGGESEPQRDSGDGRVDRRERSDRAGSGAGRGATADAARGK